MTGFNPAGTVIRDANFTNATGLNATALAQASSLQNIILTGTGITRAQLRNAGVFNTILNTITF